MLWTHFKGQQSYENNNDVVKMRTMAGGGGGKIKVGGWWIWDNRVFTAL